MSAPKLRIEEAFKGEIALLVEKDGYPEIGLGLEQFYKDEDRKTSFGMAA